MARALIVLSLWSAFLQGATPADSAVFGVLQRADTGLAHFTVLRRTSVTEELDLVIAMGSPKTHRIEETPWFWWGEARKIGLFLQEKTRPGLVYSLGIKSGIEDCAEARIERATATDSVISCKGEKSTRYPHQKWVYDVRAKSPVGQFSYQPFVMHRIFPDGDGAIFVGSDTQRLAAVGFKPGREPEFRVLSDVESSKWIRQVQVSEEWVGIERKRFLFIQPEPFRTVRFGPSGSFRLIGEDTFVQVEEQSGNQIRSYTLPQSTFDELVVARPPKVKSGYSRGGTEIVEIISSWELERDQLWFGKSFYDREGHTGIGGFGYFAAADRTYHLFAPPEIVDWSVSAIEVAPDAVWMTLVHNGEWGGSSGGLLRYDRQSGALRRLELRDIGVRLIRAGGKILAATDSGIAVAEGDQVKRYFIDRTTDGRLRVAPASPDATH